MDDRGHKYVYGPVYSRRLGHSLGVDIVPYKVCTYDCIYCQLGRTTERTPDRRELIPLEGVLEELDRALAGSRRPDWITLAGSGEPTLHTGIGDLIRRIKKRTDIPLAVLTNGSLLYREDVREDLMPADLVLPSLDAGDETMFRHINRPHPQIGFSRMVKGLETFRSVFKGRIWLEVMLLAGYTAVDSEAMKIASLCSRIQPDKVQLNTAVRPPAEVFAEPASIQRIEDLKAWFDPEPESIHPEAPTASPDEAQSSATDEEILALLDRRPCSYRDLADGLGINPAEAAKRLDVLTRQGLTIVKRNGGDLFYQTARGATRAE